MKSIALALSLALGLVATPVFADTPAKAAVTAMDLDAAIAGSHRKPENVARDAFRHPAETLRFFGVEAGSHLIEITPGGGWYTEILAPWLAAKGTYVAATWDDAVAGQPDYRYRLNNALRERFKASPELYGNAQILLFDPKAPVFGPAGTADTVVTFRNAHNWIVEGTAEAYFKAFFDVLKPGGVLGVTDHRAAPGTEFDPKSGYVTEQQVIDLAQKAGFTLVASDEINANPKDTRNHPRGVWTLPPTLALGETDRDKYIAIGESDRMTLKFVKPAAEAAAK